MVILSAAKDLCPDRPGYGLARCFALLSMTTVKLVLSFAEWIGADNSFDLPAKIRTQTS